MKKLIQLKLKFLAKIILRKYSPKIIGITGSVGKTSTKEAIFNVLSSKFNTRESIKNYNNELGVPLSIIGVVSPGRSLFGWAFVFFKALKLILFKDKKYPEFLVLEFGVDRPGDMKYLTSIAKCDVGVITTIGPSHLEFFKTVKNTQKEKGVLIKDLKRDGWAILNYDDEMTKELKDEAKTKILTYGFHSEANVRAQNLVFSFEENRDINNMSGISFKLNHDGSVVPIKLPRVIGYSAIYSSLAAASVGIAYKMNLVEISDALRNYYLPCGRMNLIKGIKNTLIIDDSYNSSPQSSISAIDFIKKIDLDGNGRKWAVLGDMMELGSYTEEGHREVGQALQKGGFDKLITVGERARDIARGAREGGMRKEDVYSFDRNIESGKFIQERMEEGDLILIKGSQGARVEKIVKEIMADPMNAKNLLVRQGKEWRDK